MNMAPAIIMHDISKQTHVVLSIGAHDGCAVHMSKHMMETSPNIKHALLLQGPLTAAQDSVFEGFSTVFAPSPLLQKEAEELQRAADAVVVPAWSLPFVDAAAAAAAAADDDDGDGDDDDDCDGRSGSICPALYYDTHLPSEGKKGNKKGNLMPSSQAASASASASASSSLHLTVCLPNEHVPHPLQVLGLGFRV